MKLKTIKKDHFFGIKEYQIVMKMPFFSNTQNRKELRRSQLTLKSIMLLKNELVSLRARFGPVFACGLSVAQPGVA